MCSSTRVLIGTRATLAAAATAAAIAVAVAAAAAAAAAVVLGAPAWIDVTIGEERPSAEITVEELLRVVSHARDSNESQLALSTHHVAPVREIPVFTGETLEVFVRARERVDVAEPDQVAGASVLASLDLPHAARIASTARVLHSHDRDDIASEVLSEVVLGCHVLAFPGGEAVEAVSPGVVRRAGVLRG